MPPSRTRTCVTPECSDKNIGGSAFGVYINNSDECTYRLARPSQMRSPGLAVQLTENSVGIRDGSVEFPIKLPAMQASNLQAMPALVGILPDGTLVAWKFGNFSGNKKLALFEGQLVLQEDYLSDLISAEICEESNCSLIDGLLGYKSIINHCVGEPDKAMIQICKAPKCCCETPPEEECNPCEPFDTEFPEDP